MVQIAEEPDAEILNTLLSRRRKNVRLTAFTSSASLILSWPFPLLILCFQTNQRRIFDPRIYAALFMAFLLSGFFRRVLLRRFLSTSILTTIMPAALGLIGNGVFMAALYKGENWNWISLFFMFSSRLCFGWSTYSVEDFNRRAKNSARGAKESERTQNRVEDMVPDLQDVAFHAGVLVAIAICFILEVCLRRMGPQMAEFYSMLILSGFSAVLSFISVPCLHKAVRGLIHVDADQQRQRQGQHGDDPQQQQTSSTRRQDNQIPNNSVGLRNRLVSQALVFRNKYLVSTIFRSPLGPFPYPPGQLAMTVFSALLTSATILFDYILLPYLVVYLRRPLFSEDYFPFPDFLLIYASLFSTELAIRSFLLSYSSAGMRARRLKNSTLIGALILVSAVAVCTPAMLYSTGASLNFGPTSLYGFLLFLLCVGQASLKAGHVFFGGLLFVKYCDAPNGVPRTIAESGEQLLGIARCFFTALLFVIAGAVLYYKRFVGALLMLSTVNCLTLAVGIFGLVQVLDLERALSVRVTMA